MDFPDAARRARLVARHHLAGTAGSVVDAARSVVALHATDPATVYLSVLARCAAATLDDVAGALYGQRALVRLLAMRRTMFVAPREVVPVVHHAASLDVAAGIRTRLLAELAKAPTDPPLPADREGWLVEVEDGVAAALAARGTATGAQLARDEPRLRTAVLPTSDKAWDVRRAVTTQVLTMMGAQGRIVRCAPRGTWLSRHHTWELGSAWWPGGIDQVPDARAQLVARYLRSFGPATEADVAWWTGWPLGVTRAALAGAGAVEVGVRGGVGLVLADDRGEDAFGGGADPAGDTAALLPALDPTPMGWKQRDWYLPADPAPLFDRNGNIGPTVWWRGEVVGGWAVRPDGSVATRLLVDRGAAARRAVAEAADALAPRLGGAVVVPSFRTPLEKTLAGAVTPA